MESSDAPKTDFIPRVIVKFHDDVVLPYEDNVQQRFESSDIGPWGELVAKFPHIVFNRLFSLDSGRIRDLVEQADRTDPSYDPPNLLKFFVVDYPPEVDPWELTQALSTWDTVETAYVDPPARSPQSCILDPRPPDSSKQCTIDGRTVLQGGHLSPAPTGVDALYAWGFSGGGGQDQCLIDLELGWVLNHEALTDAGNNPRASLLRPDLFQQYSLERDHGTKVLGVIHPRHEGCGGASTDPCDCRGIAPCTAVDVVSYFVNDGSHNTPVRRQNRANALLIAIDHLSFGDVLLIEAETRCFPHPDESPELCQGRPIEIHLADFEMIRLATALGIIVVETAGNSGGDLASLRENGRKTGKLGILDPSSSNFRDSGAIMVGAATAATPHNKVVDKEGDLTGNYGDRIDCYAWGECVYTSCSNKLGPPTTNQYTSYFDGTSSAAAIIAGVVLVVQGLAQKNLNYRYNPSKLREILRDENNGTKSANGKVVDQIGVMPDLRKIINHVLHTVPDVYIRDYVGDTGDPHLGPISSSPDIILRPTEVPKPQDAYGNDSPTKNSNTLGATAEAGQDNFIYVRVLNRGGSAATDVQAHVYWSRPAMLITPNRWKLVGSTTISTVPAGDILTVSNAITWPKDDIPAPGNYCFVGLVGNLQDPAPLLADLLVWNNFLRFIRENNNVTWSNFNVVDNVPNIWMNALDLHVVELPPFFASGAPDRALRMQLEVVARLPERARLWLKAPLRLLDAMQARLPSVFRDEERQTGLLPVHPHGRSLLGEALFEAGSQDELQLLVHIPENLRAYAYEVFARQLFEGEEVGRITWRLAPLGQTPSSQTPVTA